MPLLSPALWISCLCAFLGIALQFQVTPFYDFNASRGGIRLSLADLALPIAGIAIAVSLLRQRSLWPIWTVTHFYAWLGGFTLLFLAALFQSHALFDTWSQWGITNKIPGIIVVSAYACLGGWIGTNAGDKHIILFLRCLFGFFIAMMAVETICIFYQDFWVSASTAYGMWPHYPIEGFIDNRNAYALFSLIIVAFMLSLSMDGHKVLPTPIVYAAMIILPYFLIQIGSRAGYIALAVMFLVLLIIYRKKILPFALSSIIGLIAILAAYTGSPEKLQLFPHHQLAILERIKTTESTPKNLSTLGQDLIYQGDNFRLQILDVSFDMIKDRPLFGSGLGSSFFVQEQVRGRHDIIESTPVWIWVEMGLFGLIAFGVFYYFCMRAMIRNAQGDDLHATLNRGMLAALAAFTVMTCLHEMMMTRQVWFLLGLALALPAASIRKRQGV